MFFKTMEQHENLRKKIREFAEEEVKPIAFMLDQENKFPEEAINKLRQSLKKIMRITVWKLLWRNNTLPTFALRS